MPRNRKGSDAELEVARLLAGWWGAVEPATEFVRTPKSGGWGHAGAFQAAGDVMVTPGSRFPFAVEVKRREQWSPRNVLLGRRSPVWGWWGQCCRDGRKISKTPMLWCRRNRGDWWVLLPDDVAWEKPLATSCPFLVRAAALHAGVGAEDPTPLVVRGPELLSTDPRIW